MWFTLDGRAVRRATREQLVVLAAPEGQQTVPPNAGQADRCRQVRQAGILLRKDHPPPGRGGGDRRAAGAVRCRGLGRLCLGRGRHRQGGSWRGRCGRRRCRRGLGHGHLRGGSLGQRRLGDRRGWGRARRGAATAGAGGGGGAWPSEGAAPEHGPSPGAAPEPGPRAVAGPSSDPPAPARPERGQRRPAPPLPRSPAASAGCWPRTPRGFAATPGSPTGGGSAALAARPSAPWRTRPRGPRR